MHACGRKGFTINRITKDTYTCSLHFVGGNGPTESASLLECELVRKKGKKKRKRPLERDPLLAGKKKVRKKKQRNRNISIKF